MAAKRQASLDYPLAELHAHLGTSVSAEALWQIAHRNGFKLPKRELNDFREYIMLSPERRIALNTYFNDIYHPLLDKLCSGVQVVEDATYQTITGAYHSQNITLIELRNGLLRHNRGGEFELDQTVMGMLRGMERALLECPGLSAGLIFMMLRDMTYEENEIVVRKAIKYRSRGVVGIDVGGPPLANFAFKDYAGLIDEARKAGLRITVHTGETLDANDMWEALEYAKPERIGHGIRAAYDKALLKELSRRKVVLEICPLSNIMTKAVENNEEMRFVLRTIVENKVPFCINTDWPEMIKGCRLRSQMQWLLDEKMLTEEELHKANQTAFESSFIPGPGGLDSYLFII